jgi:hypothetical protein
VKPQGVAMPPVPISDFAHYKGGDSAVESVTITGPFDPRGPGETASRSRIFICSPANKQEEETCAGKILSSLARRAYRRPVTSEDLGD